MGVINHLLIEFRTYSKTWNPCLVPLSGSKYVAKCDIGPREECCVVIMLTHLARNWLLGSYLYIHD